MDRMKALPIALYSRAVVAALTVVIVAAACSSKEAASADSTGPATATAQTATNSPAGAMMGKIHLDVTGGANAGSYDVDMKEGGCSYGLAGEKAWGNQYSTNTSDPKQLSSLQLIVPDAKAAAKGTTVFQMTAGFGPLFGKGQTSYDINTRPEAATKKGSGTVTVDDKGSTGHVTFDAKTAEGVGLKGTIDCASVMRAS